MNFVALLTMYALMLFSSVANVFMAVEFLEVPGVFVDLKVLRE